MKTAALALSALLGLAATPGPASIPDSWLPFRNQRVVAPDGAHYLVIRKEKRGIRFEFVRRAPGAPAIEPATAKTPSTTKRGEKPKPGEDAKIARDPKDELVAKGTYDQLPLETYVADGGKGFLLFDQYARVGYGKTLTWADATGAIQWSLTLKDIFGRVPPKAMATVSSLWWKEAAWLDSNLGVVGLIAAGDELREVDLATGKVVEPSGERISEWLEKGSQEAAIGALDLLIRKGRPACQERAPLLVDVFQDADRSLAVRTRAAVALATAGSPVMADAVFRAALEETQPKAVRQYAMRHAGVGLGVRALPLLRAELEGKAGPLWRDCIAGFGALGEAAVPTLCELMLDEDEAPDCRRGAADALQAIPSDAAVPALLKAVDDEDTYLARNACRALVANTSGVATEALLELLAAGTIHDVMIARRFVERPDRKALPALREALERVSKPRDRDAIEHAIAACEGGAKPASRPTRPGRRR